MYVPVWSKILRNSFVYALSRVSTTLLSCTLQDVLPALVNRLTNNNQSHNQRQAANSCHDVIVSVVCIGVRDFGLRTCDFRLRTCNFGLATSDFRLATLDFRLRTCDFGLRTCDFRLRTCDFRLRDRTCHLQLQTSDLRLQSQTWFFAFLFSVLLNFKYFSLPKSSVSYFYFCGESYTEMQTTNGNLFVMLSTLAAQSKLPYIERAL